MITKELLASTPVQHGCIFLAPDGRYLTMHYKSNLVGGQEQLGLTTDINQAFTGWSIPAGAKYSDDFPRLNSFIKLGSRIQSVRIVRLAELGPPPAATPSIAAYPPAPPTYRANDANTNFGELGREGT